MSYVCVFWDILKSFSVQFDPHFSAVCHYFGLLCIDFSPTSVLSLQRAERMIALQRQEWLREIGSMLLYSTLSCVLVISSFIFLNFISNILARHVDTSHEPLLPNPDVLTFC